MLPFLVAYWKMQSIVPYSSLPILVTLVCIFPLSFIFYLFINLINDFIVLYISLLCISYLLFLYRDFFYILILFICNLISFIYTSSNFTIPLNYSIWKFEIILDFWHIYILTHPLFVFGHLIFLKIILKLQLVGLYLSIWKKKIM